MGMYEEDSGGSEVLTGCITGLLLAAVSAVVHGLVLVKLWAWFVVEKFGAPALDVPSAIGITLLVGLVAHPSPSPAPESASLGEALTKGATQGVGGPVLVLFLGWIVRMFPCLSGSFPQP